MSKFSSSQNPFLFLFLFFFHFSMAQTWTTVGPENSIPGQKGKLLVAQNGDIFVGSIDPKLFKWNGTSWQMLSQNFIPGWDLNASTDVDYEITSSGEIYLSAVIFNTSSSRYSIQVRKYSSNTWTTVYSVGIPIPFNDIEPDKSGNMVLAKPLHFLRFSSQGSLDSIPAPDGYNTPVSGTDNSFCFNSQNELFASWTGFIGGIGVKTAKWTGSSWTYFPTVPLQSLAFTKLKVYQTDGLRLFYQKISASGYPVFLKHWNGVAWETQPDSLPIPSSVSLTLFELDGDGNAIIDDRYGNLFRWRNNQLETLNSPFTSAGQFNYSSCLKYDPIQQKIYQLRNNLNPTGAVSTLAVSTLPTSVGEVFSEKQVCVFPNPTTGKIQFSGIDLEVEEVDVTIFNTAGKLISSQHKSDFQEINLQGQPNGFYFVKVKWGVHFQIFKVLKE